MIQEHPTSPRSKLVHTGDERTAAAVAAYLSKFDMPATVVTFAQTGGADGWHHVSVGARHAKTAHLVAEAFRTGMREGLDQQYSRPRYVEMELTGTLPAIPELTEREESLLTDHG